MDVQKHELLQLIARPCTIREKLHIYALLAKTRRGEKLLAQCDFGSTQDRSVAVLLTRPNTKTPWRVVRTREL